MSNSSNDESQNTTQIQFANSNVQVQEYSNFGSSSRLSHIPLDLMDDILFRLPADSITRLRMTCRAWASMTTKPRFTYKHLKERMKQNDPIVVFERSNGEDKLCFLSNYSSEQACSFRILHFKLPYGFVKWNEHEVSTLGGSSNASCKWRQLEGIPNYIAANDMAPVFLNGAIHWLLRIGNYINGKSKSKLILAFDVRTEATRMLPVPEGLRFCRLLELGGCLCIIEIENWNSKVASLYILKDYDNCKWKKEQTIDFFPSWSRPVATRDGKLLFPPYYYDTKDGTSGNFFSLSNPSTREECNNIFRGCAESLVSPILLGCSISYE
ncbi:putative F-box protein At2g19630 [Carex rostrata]